MCVGSARIHGTIHRVSFWQTVVIAAVPSLAAIAAVVAAAQDLGLRRRLESSRQFLNLFAVAHGRPADGRTGVGLGEQVATVHLIADFAVKEKLVREAARAGLAQLANWGATPASFEVMLAGLPDSVPSGEREAVARARAKRSDASINAIATAANDALARLNRRKPSQVEG